MKFGILGATGPTGQALLRELAGADVAVFVRSPEKLPQGVQVSVTQGQLSDTAALKKWAGSCDIVLNALGHTS